LTSKAQCRRRHAADAMFERPMALIGAKRDIESLARRCDTPWKPAE